MELANLKGTVVTMLPLQQKQFYANMDYLVYCGYADDIKDTKL